MKATRPSIQRRAFSLQVVRCLSSECQGVNGDLGSADTIASLLRKYGRAKDLSSGRDLHALLRKHRRDSNTFLLNCVIEMYGDCGCYEDAKLAFNRLPCPNNYSFNIMMKVCGRHGKPDEARALFERIPVPDLCSWTTLINAYGQNGYVDDAMWVFKNMPQRNVVSWTAMIASFSQNGRREEALMLFHEMQVQGIAGNNITFTCALDACAGVLNLELGKKIHAAILIEGCSIDVALNTSLINMYGKCKCVNDALKCFSSLNHQNVATWTAMISAVLHSGYNKEVLEFFFEMHCGGVSADNLTYMSALNACTSMLDLEAGQVVHAVIAESNFINDAFVENALVVMYGRCGKTEDANKVFDRSVHRDVVSWTGIIGALVQNGKYVIASELFVQMLFEGIIPDKISLLSIIEACCNLFTIDKGRQIHSIIVHNVEYTNDLEISNSLINMYGKCGHVQHAGMVFHHLKHRDIFSWNTMMATYVQNGKENHVVDLFEQMNQEFIEPDNITLVCVLTACSHAGWINEAVKLFMYMINEHQKFTSDHFVCMIDLLARIGCLDEAERFVCNTPSPDNVTMAWLSLLGACKIHDDMERGLRASKFCMELEPENTAPYVLLSNICTTSDRWVQMENSRMSAYFHDYKKSSYYSSW